MADLIIKEITPYLVDIGLVTVFISVAGMIINLAKNAFTKGKVTL